MLANYLRPGLVATLCLLLCLLAPTPALQARVALGSPSAIQNHTFQNPPPGTVQDFLNRQPGVLKHYRDGAYTATQVIEGYATYYSLNPHILLTLLELKGRLLSDPQPAQATLEQPFTVAGPRGFAAHLDWATRELRAGFGPYSTDPVVQFSDGSTTTISRGQEPAIVAVQRFLARGHTQAEWKVLVDGYEPLYRQYFGDEPMAPTPTATPAASSGFLSLPWPAGTRVIHSSYFDHVYPTVDRGGDGNDYILNHLGESNLSYNTHDGHDFYFPDAPIGTPMLAAASGTAYAFTTRGNGVVIRHAGALAGYETIYWHLDQFDIKFQNKIDSGIGVPVSTGDVLGTSGKSGFVVGGAHLHFEVRHNGRQVDPYGWYGGGSDPCAAWTIGCEASVWLWRDNLRGTYDFTPPDAPPVVVPDTDPPVGTLRVTQPDELGLLLPFDDHPVQTVGAGFPEITASRGAQLRYGDGVRGRAVRIEQGLSLTYPISDNLDLTEGTLAVWANVPDTFPDSSTKRHYLFAASQNPGDSARGIYANTFALRHQRLNDVPEWNFWTVDDAGTRHDLVVTDTLEAGWHHFAVSWNQAGIKRLYIDGVPVAQGMTTMPTFVGARLQVGSWTAGYGELGAALDELAVWKRALDPEELAQLVAANEEQRSVQGLNADVPVVYSREVTLDTNAIDAQGGIVSVQLKRDDEPWGEPLPYFDSYKWTITGTEGLHTFAVRYRDRADNVTEVTTTVELAFPTRAEAALVASTPYTATIALTLTHGFAPLQMQVSAMPDFAGAVWEPLSATKEWSWIPGAPQVAYVRIRDGRGAITGPFMVGSDVRKLYLPLTLR